MKVDVVIPTRNPEKIEKKLLEAIKREPRFKEIIITQGSPLSKARFEGVKQASTEWVAMFDDDVLIPSNWLQSILVEINSKTGAVATVRRQKDTSLDAYYRVLSFFYQLHTLDSDPNIGNVLIKRSLMLDFQPTPVFTGEDQYLRKHIENSGHLWKTIPYIGVIHTNRTKINEETGIYYKRFQYYTNFQILRRLGARLLFGSFTPLVSHQPLTPFSLWKDDIKFVSGWLKETINPP